MNKIDWDERALNSEIEYSKARGGKVIQYKDFVHIYNDKIPYSGDYNHTVGIKISGFNDFKKVVKEVGRIHKEKHLDKPDRYDIYPPTLNKEKWRDYLSQMGYYIYTAIFFCSNTTYKSLPDGIKLYLPTKDEYIKWYYEKMRLESYFDEKWFGLIKPLQLNFIKTFKPYWLIKDDTIKGWVYFANLGDYCRLFEVEIKEEFRDCGLGTILLNAVRNEASNQNVKHILLSTTEDLREFYEKVGFRECSRNTVVRLKNTG